MIAHHRWTQTDITNLRARLQDGGTVHQIGAEMQRSPEDVRLMMNRLRLK